MTSSYWFQGLTEGPDLGDSIGQSLRFRFPSNQLQRSITTAGDNTTWTFSSWVKHASVGGNRQRMLIDGGDQVGGAPGTSDLSFDTSDHLKFLNYQGAGNGGPQNGITSVAVFRDPSAWYHIVLVYDSTNATESERIRLYVNGQRQSVTTPDGMPTQNEASFMMTAGQTTQLGGRTNNTVGDMDDYQSSVYFIDGQALEPEAFGRYNRDGVWVPVKLDWSRNNSVKYSDFLTCSGSGFAGASPATNAFDGSTTTFAEGQDANSVITWTPPGGVAYTSSVQVWSQRANTTASINGGAAVALNDNAITEIATGSGTINTLTITGTLNGQASLGIIQIDGDPVLNPYMWSAGLTANQPFAADGPPEDAFTGTVNSSVAAKMVSGSDGSIVWTPTEPINFNDTVRVWSNSDALIFFNDDPNPVGQAQSEPNDGWVTVATGGGTLTSIGLAWQTTAVWFNAVEIDGQIYKNGTNPSYGVNGYHLDFSDPNDIGADRSGNGNNFTPNGFDTAPVGVFDQDFFTETGNTTLTPNWGSTQRSFLANFGPERALNGNTDLNDCVAPVGSGWVFFRREFTGVTSLRVWGALDAIGVNDVVVGPTPWPGSGPHDLTAFIPGNGTITSLACMRNAQFGFSAIEINGNILVNNPGADYDLMQDSPTQNWATGNPLDFVPGNTPPSFNFSKANLAGVGASAGLYHGFASTAISADDTNTYYMEFSSPQASGGYPGVFVTQVNADPFWTNGLIWSAQSNDVSYNLVAQTPWTGATYTANAVAGFSYNGSTGVITGYVDGVEAGTFTADTGIDRVFGVLAPPQNITVMDFNYGQRPFIHQPAGTVPLQTQNLDKPTIVDGGEHFRTLTGTGASILSIAQGDANGDNGTGFQRGLWWIKSRINPDGQINEHQISNSALPADSWAHLPGNFNSFEAYQTPVSDSVAWCWAGDDVTGADLAAVNANGDLPLSGLVRNIDAGMSSGYYNGSPDGTEQAAGTELSFPHGLSQAPEFVAVTLMDDNGAGSTNMWQVYSSSPNDRAVRSLILRSSDSGFDPDFFWTTEQEATTDTLVRVRVGPSDLVSNTLNRRRTCGYDSNYFFMAFHSVPGYSSFGNYTGNDNDGDGPFVYTGFRPSFLLIKSVDLNTENWVMLDGSRSTDNPVADYLMANKSQEEKDGTSFAPAIAVDFLANGFKIRGSNNINLGTGRYFYAAFARHPFGGKGIAPSTAAFVGPDYYDGILPGIANSLRFRGAQQLIGPGYKGTTTTGTFSCWIKFATSDPTAMYICGQQIIAGTAGCDLLRESNSFSPANVINQGQAPVNQFQSPGSIRDQSAWYNLVWNFNGGTNTAELYINGVLVDTLVNTNNRQVSGNDNWPIIWGNNGAGTSTLTLQAYLADCYYVDGQALDATQFGQYDTNGVWVPNEYTGTYGANGFHLVMDPAYQSGDILRDQSGNGNDFTMTGFETGDFYSADFDYMKDGPTENYATFNPLFTNGNTGPGTLSDGNLGYTAYVSPGYKVVPGTQSLKGGAYYWEYTAGNVNNSYPGEVGIIRGTSPATSTRIGWDTNNNVFGFALRFNGELIGDSSGEGTSTDQTLTNLPTGFSQGDIIGMYCDIPNNYLAWYKNGVLHYEITNVNSEYDWIPAAGQYYNFAHNSVNFGQQPFRYPLPAGYQALQTANLPEPTIANGRDHFGVSLYTGTNPSVSVTDLNFQPDFVWIKCRTASTNHALFDSVRGVELALSSESTAGESPNDGTRLNSFDSNGFTVGTNSNVNDFGKPMVAWCWKAGGAAVTNNDGSIETQVSANVDAGFSIISYIGNGVDGSTLGHGLNRAPEFIILKNRDANVSDNFWSVYHASAFQSSAAPQILYLNRSDGGSNDTNVLGTTVDINATTFTIGTYNGTNLNSDNHIAYCWHSVPGYSAFGRYTGNDNADGPFVYTGFRPAFVLVKRSNGDSNWCMLDSTRDVANPTDRTLFANSDGQEVNSGDSNCDFLSNGFKVRHSNGAFNNDGDTYIYCAFAENPINISNAK